MISICAVRHLRPELTEWLCSTAPGKCWLWSLEWPELRRIETGAWAWRQARHRCTEPVSRGDIKLLWLTKSPHHCEEDSDVGLGRWNDSVDCCGKMTATASHRRRQKQGRRGAGLTMVIIKPGQAPGRPGQYSHVTATTDHKGETREI